MARPSLARSLARALAPARDVDRRAVGGISRASVHFRRFSTDVFAVRAPPMCSFCVTRLYHHTRGRARARARRVVARRRRPLDDASRARVVHRASRSMPIARITRWWCAHGTPVTGVDSTCPFIRERARVHGARDVATTRIRARRRDTSHNPRTRARSWRTRRRDYANSRASRARRARASIARVDVDRTHPRAR